MSHDTHIRRQIATTLLPGFVGTTLPEWLERRLREGLGGVCVFGPNIESHAQLRELTDAIYAANPEAIIAIDEEGGDVTRLYYDSGSPYPGNAILGRIDDLGFTEWVANSVGWELRAAGCNVTFAPDVDINSNPDNPVIGVRSFGTEPAHVSAHSAAWTRGLQAAGVAVSAKHFPGHGDTALDSHLALPVIDRSLDELRERELLPFRAVIDAGAKTIMTSHILLPQLDAESPATFSRLILGDLLRGELGFTGVIVTDALDMHGASGVLGIPGAAFAALAAGCDLLCIGTENTDEQLDEITDRVLAAIGSGELDAARVSEASTRVLELARELARERESLVAPRDSSADGDAAIDAELLHSAFDVSVDVAGWLDRASDDYRVVRIDTVANIAVGVAPWGPFAQIEATPREPLSQKFAARELTVVSADTPWSAGDEGESLRGASVLVIGKDNHRHDFARDAIEGLRAAGADVLAIDMGWPSDDRRYADVATFGASRAVGLSLLSYLEGGAR